MNTQSYSPFRLKATPMVVGLVLLGTGSMIGMSGMIVGGHALMSGARRWFMGMADQQMPQAMKPRFTQQPKVAMTARTGGMHGNGNGMRVRSGRA
jgi:hypothetical protein